MQESASDSTPFLGRKRVASDRLFNNADPLLRNKKACAEAKASQLLTVFFVIYVL
jgi:hypothetical protein